MLVSSYLDKQLEPLVVDHLMKLKVLLVAGGGAGGMILVDGAGDIQLDFQSTSWTR